MWLIRLAPLCSASIRHAFAPFHYFSLSLLSTLLSVAVAELPLLQTRPAATRRQTDNCCRLLTNCCCSTDGTDRQTSYASHARPSLALHTSPPSTESRSQLIQKRLVCPTLLSSLFVFNYLKRDNLIKNSFSASNH
jgi:hypothetical protein